MSYESSYDTGGGAFRPNKDRGFWSSSSDFLFSCVLNAFRMDFVYGVAAIPVLFKGGIFMVLAVIFNMLLYAIPIVFIQSFLGQFSSSGLISVFRISPLFKGMGYIGLVINLCSLAFYSVFAAVPLLFFFHSLQPIIPWSCEGFDHGNVNEIYYAVTYCNLNISSNILEDDSHIFLTIPSVEFFSNKVQESFSFSLFGCVLIVWVLVSLVLYNTTERIGQILRYCAITLITLLAIVFIRMACLPGVKQHLMEKPPSQRDSGIQWAMWIFMVPILMFTSFGPGWGTVLSMASYNKFKTNITKYSWMICLSQMGVLLMVGMVCMFTEIHLTKNKPNVMTPVFEMQWSSFLTIPSALANLELPHFWTWMFLTVLIIGSFNLVVVQMFSVLTAVFDEFEEVRPHRTKVIFGTASVMALISGYFCTSDGILFIEMLAELSVVSQGSMNLFLLIIMLWVYGRERFQRDVEFMTSQVLATWKVYMVRFITPLFLGLTLFVGLMFSFFSHGDVPHLAPIGFTLTFMPWIALPAYCIYRLIQTNGTIALRFKRCIKPTDWYPVQPEDRQRYEETVDNPETSQPLTSIVL